MPPSSPNLKRSLLSSTTPTLEEICHLILHQPTPSKALQTFHYAFHHHHTPSTLHSLIQSLTSFNLPHLALRFLLLLSPFPPLESSVLSLIRSFSSSPHPHSALHLLSLFPPSHPPPLSILNSLLHLLARQNIDLARRFFRTTMAPHRRHDDRTFGILMKGLCGTNRIAEAFKLLQLMKTSVNAKPNPVVYNTLIHALCRNGKVGRARSLMGEMEELSEVTFHVFISAYCKEDNLVQALVMLEKCFDAGFVPDAITMTKVVEVLCGHGRAMEAVELLERVERKGGVVDVVGFNTLIKGFCGMGKPEVGRRVLREMERKGCLPNVHSYNALVCGFCESGRVDSGMDVFREMGMVGVTPNFETFDTLIRGFCMVGRVEDGMRILGMMEDVNRINPYNSILYGYYKANRLEEGYEFLKGLVSFFPRAAGRSLRIFECCEEGNVGEAKVVYDQMVKEGDIPSVIVYVNLIKGLSGGGNVREAFDLMNEMVERRYFPVVSTFNALINGFCKEDKLRSASKLLEEMVGRGCIPNAGSYNPLISAVCRQGDVGRASSLLVQMVERGIVPDYFTWNWLVMNEGLGIATANASQFVASLCDSSTDG